MAQRMAGRNQNVGRFIVYAVIGATLGFSLNLVAVAASVAGQGTAVNALAYLAGWPSWIVSGEPGGIPFNILGWTVTGFAVAGLHNRLRAWRSSSAVRDGGR